MSHFEMRCFAKFAFPTNASYFLKYFLTGAEKWGQNSFFWGVFELKQTKSKELH